MVKAPCRWAAARHALSRAGNDYLRLVVNLVREGGTKASIHNNPIKGQAVSRDLEKVHRLVVLPSAGRGRSSRGDDPAEWKVARRRAHAAVEQVRRCGWERRTWASLPKADREARVGGGGEGRPAARATAN